MTLYDIILNTLESRKIAKVQMYAPYYVCSAMAHLFNIKNKTEPVYYEAGRIPDMRIHIMFVAPPGFSKSFWLEQFLRGNRSIFGTTSIQCAFEGTMTEAAWTGTIRFMDENKEPVIRPGAAHEFQTAILGIEEFSALTNMMKSQHSKLLDNALLTSLDSGWLFKRLAAGPIRYITHITLHTGTQPARFDLSSGLGRRFMFLLFNPSKGEMDEIKLARRRSQNILGDSAALSEIRQRVRYIQDSIKRIQTVVFDRSIQKAFDTLPMPHYEEPLYERLFLGYTLATQDFNEHVVVKTDTESMRLLTQVVKWRRQVKRGSEVSQVASIINEAGGVMTIRQFREKMLDFGVDWQGSTELMNQLQRMRVVIVSKGEIRLWRRRTSGK